MPMLQTHAGCGREGARCHRWYTPPVRHGRDAFKEDPESYIKEFEAKQGKK